MDSKAPCVAIVDDELDQVTILSRIFDIRKIPVSFVAYNGLEAVDLFKEVQPKPDVIIMDHRMPVANGVEATREILALDPRVKILFLSADPGIMDDALGAGAACFMKKPVSVRAIVDAVRGAI